MGALPGFCRQSHSSKPPLVVPSARYQFFCGELVPTTSLECFVPWDGQMMLAAMRGGQAKVASGLTCDLVPESR
jgi:hypothetical protein